MKVDGAHYRTIWVGEDGWSVQIIDQTRLPHDFAVRRLASVQDAADAIQTMAVRGAPLIGATAAYGLCLQARADSSDKALNAAYEMLLATRPTAVNLRWALDMAMAAIMALGVKDRVATAYAMAARICDDDVATCESIGRHGLALIREAGDRKPAGSAINILTHCNAGWLATVDWGTALAPIYMAHDAGIDVHVWVDETRPRNQGASLTAWELGQHGVPHTVIADNTGGHLMQRGDVDLCITGTDRTTAAGDVCNKIGTYLKALAAIDNHIPFYVALPHTTIDWEIEKGADIPIEQRDGREITHITGQRDDGSVVEIRLTPEKSGAANFAFDVTPARLVTRLITDRGACAASKEGLLGLFPERRQP
ncbi:MAG: S-methyl-5-thioribose-1-phosphate isomerase [Proteobacteria bacterium]|nr:S-methyl-5-thioribose-1-phosphate isomerase [Pseudomonadota bacterium]